MPPATPTAPRQRLSLQLVIFRSPGAAPETAPQTRRVPDCAAAAWHGHASPSPPALRGLPAPPLPLREPTAPRPAPSTADSDAVPRGCEARGAASRPTRDRPSVPPTGTNAPAEVSATRGDAAPPREGPEIQGGLPRGSPPRGSRPHARVLASPVGAARRSRVLPETLRGSPGMRCGASPRVAPVPAHRAAAPRSSVEFPHARSGTARPGRGRVKRRDRRRGAERGRPGIRRGAGQGSAPPGAAGRAEPSPPVPCPGAVAAAPPGGAAGGRGRAPPPPAPAMSRRAAGSA